MPFVDAIPPVSAHYMRELTGIARSVWGLDAPVARFAAQIHQESGWATNAKSSYAHGLAQFTPDTASWISRLYPNQLGDNAPYSPGWAMRALVTYDKYLYDRVRPLHAPVSACDRWAMAFSAYNGGLGWVDRDRKLTVQVNQNPDKWWGAVEHHSQRAGWAMQENRGYPKKILLQWERLYLKNNWPGIPTC